MKHIQSHFTYNQYWCEIYFHSLFSGHSWPLLWNIHLVLCLISSTISAIKFTLHFMSYLFCNQTEICIQFCLGLSITSFVKFAFTNISHFIYDLHCKIYIRTNSCMFCLTSSSLLRPVFWPNNIAYSAITCWAGIKFKKNL